MKMDALQEVVVAISENRCMDTTLLQITEYVSQCLRMDNDDLGPLTTDDALVRIWLIEQGDKCARCNMRSECPDQREMMSGLRAKKLHAALTVRPPAGEMRGLKVETIRHHPPGIICSPVSPLAKQRAVRPSEIAGSKLVVYRAKEFLEYHGWVSKVLGVSKSRLLISEE